MNPKIHHLVSTRETQGARRSDFSHADEAEVVYFGWVCDRDANNPNPDGGCGCGRSMVGALTSKATTTFKVAEWAGTADQYVHHILGAMQDAGWITGRTDPEAIAEWTENAKEVLRIAGLFPIGTVLEKRGETVQIRARTCSRPKPIRIPAP